MLRSTNLIRSLGTMGLNSQVLSGIGNQLPFARSHGNHAAQETFTSAPSEVQELSLPDMGASDMVFNVDLSGMHSPLKPVAVQSRYGLPGARHPITNPSLPETLSDPKPDFPLLLQSEEPMGLQKADIQLCARSIKPHLDETLPKHGVVMIHGLGECLTDPLKFTTFMETIKAEYDCDLFMEGRSMTSTAITEVVRTGSDDHSVSKKPQFSCIEPQLIVPPLLL
jgi:hypothetical protein